jgi:hypothetical protein
MFQDRYENVNSQNDALRGEKETIKDSMVDDIISSIGGEGICSTDGYWTQAHYKLSKHVADMVFARSMIARKAVSVLPTRTFNILEGWRGKKGLDKKQEEWLEDLNVNYKRTMKQAHYEACVLGRQYGGGYIIQFWSDTEDIKQMLTPLLPKPGMVLMGSLARSCHNVIPQGGYAPGAAEYYTVTMNRQNAPEETAALAPNITTFNVHRSRIIYVPGLAAPLEILEDRGGEAYSILEYLNTSLKSWVESYYSTMKMVKSHSLFKLGISNFATKVLGGGFAELKQKFSSIIKSMNFLSAVVVDKNQDEVEFVNRTYSGLDPLLDKIDNFLMHHCDVPSQYLLNDGSLFTEAGKGARYEMASLIEDYVASHVAPAMTRFLSQWVSVTIPEAEQEAIMRLFVPHIGNALMLTRFEAAEVEYKHGQTDQMRVMSKIINLETARTRFEDGLYSDVITLKGKQTSTKEMLEMEASGGKTAETNASLAKNAATADRGRYTTPGAARVKDKKTSRKTAGGQDRSEGPKT